MLNMNKIGHIILLIHLLILMVIQRIGIMKESSIIDIHGQHDNQNLLDNSKHINYL